MRRQWKIGNERKHEPGVVVSAAALSHEPAMNYYEHHIGDFRSGTVNMTRLERWIYRDMLDVYYDKEKPLSTDIDTLCKTLGVRTDEEKVIVRELLAYKFVLTDEGYEHERCEEVISAYRQKAEKGRENGKRGAATRYQNGEYMPTAGTLYAVRVNPDLVKVGITANLKSRLNQLRNKYGRQACLLHQVPVNHMGDAEGELLDAYADVRTGEEIPVAVAYESVLVAHMDRIRVAYAPHTSRVAVASGSHQVASESPTNQKPVTNNQEPVNQSHSSGSSNSRACAGEDGPSAASPVSRSIEIAVYLRQRGIAGANSANPNISAWGDDARVTNEILDAALSVAAVRKPGETVGPNYLATIIPDLLAPKARPKPDDWHRSEGGITRKAKELGIPARAGESYAMLKDRVFSELRRREQPGAAA